MKKDILVLNDCEQYEGFYGEHYTQKKVSSVICWLNATEVVELDPSYSIWTLAYSYSLAY